MVTMDNFTIDVNYYLSNYPEGWDSFNDEFEKIKMFVDETIKNLKDQN